MEVTWTLIPALLCAFIFAWSSSLYFRNSRPPNASMEVFVVGKQWMWHLQHPEGPREINELHVPVGVPVKLTMTSEDVIHDFSIPVFRIKHDVIPGRYSSIWFQATKTGTYHFFCAQYCGAEHSGMIGWVYVMSPTDYANWLSGGAKNESMAQTGERLFTQFGCITCHVADGTGRGPVLQGLYGHPVTLRSGETRVADEAYIRQAIVNPNSMPLPKYTPIMPTFQGQIERGASAAVDRLHQVFGRRRKRGRVNEHGGVESVPSTGSRVHYLNAKYGIKSWLLTTDHKRIALLYLASITLMFFIGGSAAVLMRLQLIEPTGALVQPETYNKLFTMHGVVMIFFFLIPSIPAVLGNFLVPMMIGAQGSGFPAHQSAELVHLHHRRRC